MNNTNNVSRILKEQYGIMAYNMDISEEEIKQLGFRKLTDPTGQINAVFQFIPQIVKNIYYKDSVNKTFSKAVEGTYKVVIDPNYHLGNS